MEAADGSYRAMQILVKHTESARLASWRDPDGVVIKQRTKDAARGMLHAVLDELSLLPRADLAGAFAEKAREMSDCGSAKTAGGDLGVLHVGEMAEAFEDAALALQAGELSGVVESESGLQIILRAGEPGLVATSGAPPRLLQMDARYRVMQILVKHQASARMASWRDPGGDQIRARPKETARSTLETLRGKLSALPAPEIFRRFAQLAQTESDCASAKEGGDLGVLEPGEMMEEFEDALTRTKEVSTALSVANCLKHWV
jgi:NIMA-interacting peptidyl-prolyl cis-trans isomerase 1